MTCDTPVGWAESFEVDAGSGDDYNSNQIRPATLTFGRAKTRPGMG